MSSRRGGERFSGAGDSAVVRARRLAVLLTALAALLLTLPPAVVTAADVEQVTVPTAAEAWYQSSPVEAPAELCTLPCPEEAAPSPYPEDTLHVGAILGIETARTYVALDMAAVPFNTEIVDGTLHLPLAEAEAGTRDADTAELMACLATAPVQPAQGAPDSEAPEVDCTVSETAELIAEHDRFELDLAPFAAAWAADATNFGIALLPGEGTEEERASWRVVFHGSERDSEAAEPITAQLQVRLVAPTALPAPTVSADGDQDEAFAGPATGPPGADSQATGPGGSSEFGSTTGTSAFPAAPPEPPATSPEDPQPAAAAPEEPALSAPPEPGVTGEQAAVETIPGGFDYPQVWLLPLVFLIVGGLLGRSLTEDYELRPVTASA